jgi:hypothetical protein
MNGFQIKLITFKANEQLSINFYIGEHTKNLSHEFRIGSEVACPSETSSDFHETTWRYIPEDLRI